MKNMFSKLDSNPGWVMHI